jgi:hypothetical protein
MWYFFFIGKEVGRDESPERDILCSVTFFFPLENYTLYEIMSKNKVEPEGARHS